MLVVRDAESGKPIFIAAGTDEAVAAGFDAGAVVRDDRAGRSVAAAAASRRWRRAAARTRLGIDEALGVAREHLGRGVAAREGAGARHR